MALTIRKISPKTAQARALLSASHDLMDSLFPPEENHHLDIDALCAPGILFFGAENDGQILGVAALALRDGYGEVKSMFVAPEARGIGVANRLLAHLEQTARSHGLPLLRLETGNKLHAAVQLYERAGFNPTGPFGDYTANKTSLFYEKHLTA